MKIVIIAAVASNNAIGKNNRLLWKLADDMRFFKETTMGFPVITGRKNYESIPQKFRPLAGRYNIIITRNKQFTEPGTRVTHSLEEAIQTAGSTGASTCFIIGGGEVYKESLQKNLVHEMYISQVDISPDADTFFPELNTKQWQIKKLNSFAANDKNEFNFTVYHYTRCKE